MMSNETIAKLKDIVGAGYVIDAAQDMAGYLTGTGQPLAVVLPGNTLEVSEVVKLANQLNFKIGVGGIVADSKNLAGGIAMVMSRMNRLLAVDHENLVAEVEPGMSHLEFVRQITADKLNFPVDPYIPLTSSVGGCFSLGDAGAKSFQYGPTRTYLLGFEMVLPTGEILDIGNKCIKNVAGYDFIHFAAGSKGTLGVFTKLLVKLLPAPEVRTSVVATFPTLKKAAECLQVLLKRNIHPTRTSLFNQVLADQIAPGIGGQLVMVDFEGFRKSAKALTQEVAAIFSLAGGTEVKVIDDPAEHGALWDKWLAVKGLLNCGYSTPTIDFSVGPMKLAKALEALEGTLSAAAKPAGINAEALLGNIRLSLPADILDQDKQDLAVKINTLAMAHGGSVCDHLGSQLVCECYQDPKPGRRSPRFCRRPGTNSTRKASWRRRSVFLRIFAIWRDARC